MTSLLTHLPTGWDVDQAILYEKERVVCIRFGSDKEPIVKKMDQMLYSLSEKLKKFVAIYVCDTDQVPQFNKMYDLVDPVSVMFFFRNKLIQVDYGTGEHTKLNFLLSKKEEFIALCELVYTGAKSGKGRVISPINYARFAPKSRRVY